MQKLSIIFICILLLVGLCGCNQESNQLNPGTDRGNASQDSEGAGILADFQTTDLEGNPVGNEIFGQYNLTMINIWGTFCGPCIEEMPDIQRLHEEFKDKGVQVIGIVADNKLEDAREITDLQGATYINLMPDQSLMDNLISRFDYVPVTVFVDAEGRLSETIVSGARDFEYYSEIIEGLLEGER